MEIKVSNEKENKLMNRKEIEAVVTYTGKTPTRDEVKEELCKKLSLNPDTTVIMKIDQEYGAMASGITAHSYASKESMPVAKAKEKKANAEKKESGMGSAEPAKEGK